jgi:hypothetical protein
MEVQDGMRVRITYQIKENKIKMAIFNFYNGDIYLPWFYTHCFQKKAHSKFFDHDVLLSISYLGMFFNVHPFATLPH